MHAADFVGLCLSQAGERYVFGAEVDVDDPNPAGPWDCSELVQWATYRAGAPMPDGSWNQLAYCEAQGSTIAVGDAIATQGALLFIQNARYRHVAVSLGNGATIEARGAAYGLASFEGARRRPWTHGALVPGLDYLPPPAPPIEAPDDLFARLSRWPGRYITQPPVMRGVDVEIWQARMRERRWSIDVDGEYGPASEDACRRFQAEKRIKVDGIVGPDTWRAAWLAPIT
jgi:cell wall-associated NlpC family hydrolase